MDTVIGVWIGSLIAAFGVGTLFGMLMMAVLADSKRREHAQGSSDNRSGISPVVRIHGDRKRGSS